MSKPADWLRELEGLTTSIQTRCRSQQSLLDRTTAAGDVDRAKTLLTKYISKNCEEVTAAKALIRRLNGECAATKNGRLMQAVRALGTSLRAAIEQSNALEAKLIERVQDLESHKASRKKALHNYIDFPEDDGDETSMAELSSSNAGGDDAQQQQLTTGVAVTVARSDSERLTAELYEAAFHERNVEIGQLVAGCREINAMMQDLNQMVIDQGEQLEEIDTNVTSAHRSSVNAAEQLRRARNHQDDAGKIYIAAGACIFLLILIITALIAMR